MPQTTETGTIRKPSPSDLTDEQWELVALILPRPRRNKNGGRPRKDDLREVLNAILYQCRSGCQWDTFGRIDTSIHVD